MFTITGDYLEQRDKTRKTIRQRRKDNAEQYRQYMENATKEGRDVSVAELEELKSNIAGGSFFDSQRLPSATVLREQALRQNQSAFETRTKQIASIASETEDLSESIVNTFSDQLVDMDVENEEDVSKFRAGLLGMYGGDAEQAERAFSLVGNRLDRIKQDAVDAKVQKLLPRLQGVRNVEEANAIIGNQPKPVMQSIQAVIKNRASTYKTKEETKALGEISLIDLEELAYYEEDKVGLRNFIKTRLAAKSDLTEAEIDALLVKAMPLAESRLGAAERRADRDEIIRAEDLFRQGIPAGARMADLQEVEVRALAESALRRSGMTEAEVAAQIDAFTSRMQRQYVDVDSRVRSQELETEFKNEVLDDAQIVQAIADPDVPNRDETVLNRINGMRRAKNLPEFTGNEREYKEILSEIEAEANIAIGPQYRAERAQIKTQAIELAQRQLEAQEKNIGALLDGVKDNELALSVASQLNERYFLGSQLSDVIIAVSEKAKGKKMSPQASTQILTETIAQFNLPTKTDARKAVERQLRQELKLGPEPGTSVQAYIQEYTDSTRAKYQAAVNAIQALPVDATQDQVDKILQPFIDAANQYGPSLSAKIRRFEPRFHNSGMETAEAEAMAAAGQLLELIQGAKPQARPSYAQPVVATAPDESGNVVEQEFYRILPDQAKELGIPAGIYSIDPQTRREDELLQYEVRSVTGDLYFPELADNNIDRIRKEVAELIATDNANKGRTPAPPVARSVTSDGVPIVEGAGFFQKDGLKVAISRAYAPLLGVSDSQAFIMLWN